MSSDSIVKTPSSINAISNNFVSRKKLLFKPFFSWRSIRIKKLSINY